MASYLLFNFLYVKSNINKVPKSNLEQRFKQSVAPENIKLWCK
jgi:hypothetical protein